MDFDVVRICESELDMLEKQLVLADNESRQEIEDNIVEVRKALQNAKDAQKE